MAQLIRSFFSGDYEGGIKSTRNDESYVDALLGMFFLVEFHFYRSLNHLALLIDGKSSTGNIRLVKASLKVLTKQAQSAPDVVHKAAIIRGALEIIRGDYAKAGSILDSAVTLARRQGYIQDAATANELAAHAFRLSGAQSAAAACMTESWHDYLAWGLESKAARMVEEWDSLINRYSVTDTSTGQHATETLNHSRSMSFQTSTSGDLSGLDLSSVIKASNILSGTIVLEQLLEKLIRVVMENAGAQRGLLLLRDENGFSVETEGIASESLQLTMHHVRLEDFPDVPSATISFVERSRRFLLLNRNEMEEAFARDPYVKKYNPGSMLIQPLLHQGKLTGILYLEHRVSPNAFTTRNLQVINMLSTQIAISVDNALMYRSQQQLIECYSRFVPREFIHHLGKQSIVEVKLGDQIQRNMSILFSDIRNFTRMSELMSPEESFNFLNQYLARVSPIVRAHEGFIDKYIGDAIMALFPKHPVDAVNTAIGIQAAVREWNAARMTDEVTKLEVGIGLHSGNLMLGTIGEHERMETTVISDAVNVASRLESLTKTYGVPIIVSEPIITALGATTHISYRFLDIVRPFGKSKPISIWEILDGSSHDEKLLKVASKKQFEEGIQLYRERDFSHATDIFQKIVMENPADIPAQKYLDRCTYWASNPINEDWDGVQVLQNK